jgi:hypothetical protein
VREWQAGLATAAREGGLRGWRTSRQPTDPHGAAPKHGQAPASHVAAQPAAAGSISAMCAVQAGRSRVLHLAL